MKEMRILLADDHAALRSALRFWIEEQLIAQVFEVKKAKALLPALEKIEPDILLLDWQLPGLTLDRGDYQVLNTLRNIVPQLKIIALGMYSESKTYALDAGFDAYISKTGVPEQLSVFEQILKEGRY